MTQGQEDRDFVISLETIQARGKLVADECNFINRSSGNGINTFALQRKLLDFFVHQQLEIVVCPIGHQ